jgi:hypothetical protein
MIYFSICFITIIISYIEIPECKSSKSLQLLKNQVDSDLTDFKNDDGKNLQLFMVWSFKIIYRNSWSIFSSLSATLSVSSIENKRLYFFCKILVLHYIYVENISTSGFVWYNRNYEWN